MRCAWCRETMDYVHGHAACVNGRCPMRGVNQAPCCDGETAGQCPAPSSEIAALRGPAADAARPAAQEIDAALAAAAAAASASA